MGKKLKSLFNDLSLLRGISLVIAATIAGALFSKGALTSENKAMGISCMIGGIVLLFLGVAVSAWQFILSGLTLEVPRLKYYSVFAWVLVIAPAILIGLYNFKVFIAEIICGSICYTAVNYLIFRKLAQQRDDK